MIADSPYPTGTLVLSPKAGALAGLVATIAMLLVLAVLWPWLNFSPLHLLAQTGAMVLGGSPQPTNWSQLLLGLALYLVGGMLLGLLYAACQQRIPPRGLLSVGIFYGFVIWVLSSVLLGAVLGEALRATIRSMPHLLADLCYGLVLALVAIWADKKHAVETGPITAKD